MVGDRIQFREGARTHAEDPGELAGPTHRRRVSLDVNVPAGQRWREGERRERDHRMHLSDPG